MYDFGNDCLILFKEGQYSNYIKSAGKYLLCIGIVNVSIKKSFTIKI